MLHFADVIYIHVSNESLCALDTIYKGTFRCITNYKALIHHCSLLGLVGLLCPTIDLFTGITLFFKAKFCF